MLCEVFGWKEDPFAPPSTFTRQELAWIGDGIMTTYMRLSLVTRHPRLSRQLEAQVTARALSNAFFAQIMRSRAWASWVQPALPQVIELGDASLGTVFEALVGAVFQRDGFGTSVQYLQQHYAPYLEALIHNVCGVPSDLFDEVDALDTHEQSVPRSTNGDGPQPHDAIARLETSQRVRVIIKQLQEADARVRFETRTYSRGRMNKVTTRSAHLYVTDADGAHTLSIATADSTLEAKLAALEMYLRGEKSLLPSQ